MKRALVLGAGLVARPLVRYLLDKGHEVVVASRTVSKAEALVGDHPAGKALALDVKDDAQLEKLVSEADCVISLLPYTYHVKVARHCLEHGVHLVTTSYVSDAMKELDDEARSKGVLLLNEIGLDPGIDHMSAMKIIDEVQGRGGRIVEFVSYCGGLPAPEANDNPFGYKFSWSPRGVLMAGRNDARFLRDGREVFVKGEDLFEHYEMVEVPGAGEFEGYPNRNSLPYVELYGIEGTSTMFRGTLRNKGWCGALKLIAEIGYLDMSERSGLQGRSFASLTAELLGLDTASGGEELKRAVAERLSRDPGAPEFAPLEWLGLFSDSEKVEKEPGTVLDALCALMQSKMAFKEGERDMIVLHHSFRIEEADGTTRSATSTLIDYGIPHGDSAMARTVSLPAAIAVDMILGGRLERRGVCIPVTPDLYEPVLEELERLGIECREQWS